jgi:hypothetical protein
MRLGPLIVNLFLYRRSLRRRALVPLLLRRERISRILIVEIKVETFYRTYKWILLQLYQDAYPL